MTATALAAIAFGANLGDPYAVIESAMDSLEHEEGINLLARSNLYQSAAVGPAGQPDYINAASLVAVCLSPLSLLDRLQALELRYDRTRSAERWGPRTLDLDLITYGDKIVHNQRLTLPHPAAHHRCFVLAPLAEIAPQLTLPGHGTVTALLAHCDTGAVTKVSS